MPTHNQPRRLQHAINGLKDAMSEYSMKVKSMPKYITHKCSLVSDSTVVNFKRSREDYSELSSYRKEIPKRLMLSICRKRRCMLKLKCFHGYRIGSSLHIMYVSNYCSRS